MLGEKDKDGYELLKRAQAIMASGVPTNRGNVVNQFGGYTPTADLQTQRMPIRQPVASQPTPDIKGAYDSVFSEQAQRNYLEESANPKQTEPVNYAEQAFGLGGSLDFKDTGAKREVLRFIGAKPDAQSVNYQINREATQKARSAGDKNAIIYDFNVEDAKGNEYEIKGVSANALSELFARLRKPDESKEAVLSDSPRRVRKKGEDWRLDIESPIEEGLVNISKTSDFERDLSEFGSRALSGIRGTAADLTVSALQGGARILSGLGGNRAARRVLNENLADNELILDARQKAQDLVEQKGFENPFLAAGASGVGSVATIAPLGAVGLVGAAAGSFESGVQKSRELAARNGEAPSDIRDVAMGLGYGAAEFLAERVGLQSIKRAINPNAARKIGEKMINEAITSNPNILPRILQAAKGTGTAAAVNFAEEFATNLGQEGINDLFYEVDRDLWQTLKDAGMAGIGGAFGGGVASVTGQAAQSLSGAASRSLRDANNETLNYNNLQSNTNQGTSLPTNNALSDQENYAITRLQRLGFTEQDAIEEVISNRTGQKANTESRKQILQEFPESQAAVDGLLNKAKKIYGNSAAKVRSMFGGAREEMDASVDEQIAAAENITTPLATGAPIDNSKAGPAASQVNPNTQAATEVPTKEDEDFIYSSIFKGKGSKESPLTPDEFDANLMELIPSISNIRHQTRRAGEASIYVTVNGQEYAINNIINGNAHLNFATLLRLIKENNKTGNNQQIQPSLIQDIPEIEALGGFSPAEAVTQPQDEFQEPSDLDLTDEELEALMREDEEPIITEEAQAEEVSNAAEQTTPVEPSQSPVNVGEVTYFIPRKGGTIEKDKPTATNSAHLLALNKISEDEATVHLTTGQFGQEEVGLYDIINGAQKLMDSARLVGKTKHDDANANTKVTEVSPGVAKKVNGKWKIVKPVEYTLDDNYSLNTETATEISPERSQESAPVVDKDGYITQTEYDKEVGDYLTYKVPADAIIPVTEERSREIKLEVDKNIKSARAKYRRDSTRQKKQEINLQQSTEVAQPGKHRRTKAQRAKDALEASNKAINETADKLINEGNLGGSLVPGISASALINAIRAVRVKMNHLAIKALDEYINIEAQAIVNGTSTLEQAVEKIKAFVKDKFTKDTQISIDNEIAELVNATVEDIPKRAERERKKAEGKAKYEENMSKAEKNKAAKEIKTKASTVVKNLVKRANKGEYKGYNEITILESILKLDERLGVSKAYLRQAFNDAVAELRNPTTTNIGRATVVDARNYVKKYANALLESKKNDLIKNKLVTQILNGLDKINSYASVMQQLEVINKIMTKSNYANRLREAQRELAKAIDARKSTPGLSKIVSMMGVTIKLSPVQDLETLEKLIDIAKKIAETRTPSEGLLKEFSAIYSSLKLPIPDTKETKERESKEKTGPSSKDIEDMKDSAINAIKRILSIRNNVIPDAIESLLGKDIAGDTFKLFDAIKVYKTDSLEDINAIYEFFNNTFNVYESSVKGTGISFNEHLLSEFAKADGYKATNAILKIQARAAEAEMIENNVDKVIDGVAKLFDYKNKTLAGRLLIGKWLGENKRRNFQQTISRLVNYSSDAAYAIENAVRIPLMQAFTKAEYRAQEILHKISKEIEKSDLDKSSYIHFQVLGMTLDYLNGNQKSHSFAAFLSNAVDIRKKIQNGLYDKSTKNNNDAKEALAWFDKHIGKISEDLSDISGPIANKIKELDGKPINREADYKAFTKIALPSKAWDLFSQNFFENFKSLGAEVRAVSMIYKGEQPDERPFYWPRKAIGRIDENRVEKPVNKTGEDIEEVDTSVSVENFDDYDDYARKIETILNSGLDGAKFGQISSRTNPHSLARTQNKNLVYSLNAFDVASSFFTKATADTHATPELLKINKILGSESRRIFKQEGANALRDAVVLIARSQYNVGYKRLSNPLLKGVDPIVSEASRQMLGSYFQLYKQAIPPIKSYLLAGEGDIVKRFLALRSVIGDKENLSILGSIMSWRVTSAKEKLKNKYRRIGETSGLDFGVSRSNAVIDSFRELSAQQGGGNWIETLGDNIEKSKFLPMAFMVRQSRVSSEYLPTADSYARLVIYAAEIERRSGVKFEQFMTRRKFTAEDKKIVALADKQVNTIMGASFSKERSASLTMTSNSEYENLWKKMNYFMANALAQNSTVFRDSLQAAILDPANRAEHAKRAGLIAANAMIFLGINAGLGAGMAKIADLIGTAIFGKEEDEEEKDSIARSLTGGLAGVVKDLFFGNMGNLFNVFVTLGINLSDYTFKKATQMSNQERLKLVLDAVREHEQKGTSNEKLIERLQGIKEEARISERTLLYQGSKSYGKTAYIRPIVDMAGQYKGVINTPLDVIDLMYKEYDTEKGVTQKDMTKLYGSLLRQAPFLQADAVKLTQLGLKEIGKERKEDVKKPNRR